MQTMRHRTRCNPSIASIKQTDNLSYQSGFQLIELLIAVAIVAVIAFIAIPVYSEYHDKVNNATAARDIGTMQHAIELFYEEYNSYPDILGEVKMDKLQDPWRHPYQYLRIAGAVLKGKGAQRKDKNLVPLNTDYDLYSMGKDGASVSPLTAKMSRDDIVRAYNGKYIGLAANL